MEQTIAVVDPITYYCRMCQFNGSDLCIIGCGCTLHARCLPVEIVRAVSPLKGQFSKFCPCCNMAPVHGIKLFPLTMELLDQAVQVRRLASLDSHFARKYDDDIKTEASYLFAASDSMELSLNSLNQRTGRWTDEETDFVNFLVCAFDDGSLPMAAGVRLKDFLCSVLMCKASRLTKKMKNARLSMKLYEIKENAVPLDCEMMTTMQERFLHSIEDEATRLELLFVMDKAWRQNISNLCLQVGYATFDASAWVASLYDMERRAFKADETIRKARKCHMGLNCISNPSESKMGTPFQKMQEISNPDRIPIDVEHLEESFATLSGAFEHSCGQPTARCSRLKTRMETSAEHDQEPFGCSSKTQPQTKVSYRNDFGLVRSPSFDDFHNVFCDSSEGTSGAVTLRSKTSTFLDDILLYIHSHNLPFEHVDAWIPCSPFGVYESTIRTQPLDKLPLVNDGHATRCDLQPNAYQRFLEFGNYNAQFSFVSGSGLPGRVFESGSLCWERNMDEADIHALGCTGGANAYGIKTGVGIPLASKATEINMVIVLYSMSDVPEDSICTRGLMSDLASFRSLPSWSLVDAGNFTPGLLPKPLERASFDELLLCQHRMHGFGQANTECEQHCVFTKPSTRTKKIRLERESS